MKLHFEEEDFSERQECSAPLTSKLEGTALKRVMAKNSINGTLLRKSLKSC